MAVLAAAAAAAVAADVVVLAVGLRQLPRLLLLARLLVLQLEATWPHGVATRARRSAATRMRWGWGGGKRRVVPWRCRARG